jgi:hypothetical protein
MERTQTNPITTNSAQGQIALHHIYKRDGFAQPLYVVITNGHAMQTSACGRGSLKR